MLLPHNLFLSSLEFHTKGWPQYSNWSRNSISSLLWGQSRSNIRLTEVRMHLAAEYNANGKSIQICEVFFCFSKSIPFIPIKNYFLHVLSHDCTWDVVLYFLHLLHCRHCNCVAFLQLWLCLHVTRTLIPAHGSPKSIIWMFGESIFLSFLLLLTWCFHIRYFNAFKSLPSATSYYC